MKKVKPSLTLVDAGKIYNYAEIEFQNQVKNGKNIVLKPTTLGFGIDFIRRGVDYHCGGLIEIMKYQEIAGLIIKNRNRELRKVAAVRILYDQTNLRIQQHVIKFNSNF